MKKFINRFLTILLILSNSLVAIRQSDFANAVTIQPDGKIIVGGYAVIDEVQQFTLARINSDGTVDTSFGSPFINTIIGTESAINALKIQADGKIVALGTTFIAGQSNITLARYNGDGTLDAAFGSAGIVTTLVGTGTSGVDLAIQPDGAIVAVGTAIISGIPQFVGARYLSNGDLDNNFGAGGIVTTLIDDRAIGQGMLLQNDGKIIVAGKSTQAGISRFALVRYNSDGSLDNSFGSNGVVTTTIGTQANGFSIDLHADGKIVMAGSSDDDWALARYNTDGSLDTSFGTNGSIVQSIGDRDQAVSVKIQTDDKIVAAGSSDINAALVRYNSDGSLDSSFGTNGIALTSANGTSGINEIALQADGKIVAVGFVNNRAVVARYTPAGILDTDFSNNGILISPGPPLVLDGELQFNSFAMTKDAVVTPETIFNDVYTSLAPLFPIRAWSLHASSTTQEVITLTFNIPHDYDIFAPMEIILHLLVDRKASTGTTAAIRIHADFKSSGQELGQAAGGAQQNIVSNTFSVNEPSGNNLRHISITVPLNNTGIFPNDFAFLAFTRTAPSSGTEYNADIYLTSVSFRYKRI